MKQYIVKKFAQSPFDAHKVAQNVLILVDQETGEPFCDIEHGDDKHVKEGDILKEGSFTGKWTGKRTKHIVVGDVVQFKDKSKDLRGAYQGRVESIQEVEDGKGYFDNVLSLVNCKRTPTGELFKVKELSSTTLNICLGDVEATPWITATIPCPCCGK